MLLIVSVIGSVVLLCTGYHYCNTSFHKGWTQAAQRRFKSCSRQVGSLRRWETLISWKYPAGSTCSKLAIKTLEQEVKYVQS